MDFETVLIIGMAGAFIVSAIDYWTDIGFWRPVVAFLFGLLTTLLVLAPSGTQQILTGILTALASAFASMAFIKIVERMNIIQSRLR